MRVKSIGLWFLLPLALLACSESNLELTQSRQQISLTGTFLTESPDEIQFPVKVLFAIDCSGSMGAVVNGVAGGADPYNLRIEAVRDFIAEYNTNENTSFEVMLWNTDVTNVTVGAGGDPGFTKDIVELESVLDSVNNTSMTDYLGTLDAIYADIYNDIIDTTNEDNLIRTKYIVVFLSDGLPNTGNGRGQQTDDNIWEKVTSIAEMIDENGVGGFNFHTSLLLGLFDGLPLAQEEAETTLEGMADRGEGQFSLFDSAESIDFINIIDMRLTLEYKLKYFVAYNYNVRPGVELTYVDSDGDGLTDEEEQQHQTDPTIADTDGDGLGDFFEVKLSSPGYELNPLLADSPCPQLVTDQYPDTDNDGLNDCEEFVKGTNRRIVDTDRDGIPDGIEFLAGTNPLEVQYTTDADFDGAQDWLEIHEHTNVMSNDPKIRDLYRYKNVIVDEGLVSIDQGSGSQSYVRQYHFNISNIGLMDTLEYVDNVGGNRPSGQNRIRLYLAEVPEDNPDAPPIFRMAEITVDINDPTQSYELTPNDFELM